MQSILSRAVVTTYDDKKTIPTNDTHVISMININAFIHQPINHRCSGFN
jgi:hypothetical protein